MALQQTLISSSKKLFLCLPINPNPHPAFSSSLQSVNSRIFLRRRSVQSARYFMEYDDRRSHLQHQTVYPRPVEIPWRKELSNTVNLIGVVGTTVEIKHLPSGKVLAFARLAVRKSATETTWVNLTFWDELAHVASQHVEKGNQIFVSGRLVSDTVESEDGKQLTYYKVVVQQLNFVERSGPSGAFNSCGSTSMAERKYNNNAASSMVSIEELWQAFFANPVDWWDNRNNKKSPKYPDFKHKDTGEALWVEGRNNPPWVKSQLEILDSKMGSLHDRDNRSPVSPMLVDDFMNF